MHQSFITLTSIGRDVKHLLYAHHSPRLPSGLHWARVCNCGRWHCRTRRDDEVQIKFSYAARPEFYTAGCAAEALREDAARCVRWVWPTPATRRRLERERSAEAAMVLFQEVAV